jgi:glucose/arabinose dehydrogenase
MPTPHARSGSDRHRWVMTHDGVLLVREDGDGAIWRIAYRGGSQ